MNAKYILAGFAVIFVVAALMRRARDGTISAQGRIWLTVAAIFAVVSTWLWLW